MVVNCYARLEIQSQEELGPNGLEFNLVQGISEGLCARGMMCTPPKLGHF